MAGWLLYSRWPKKALALAEQAPKRDSQGRKCSICTESHVLSFYTVSICDCLLFWRRGISHKPLLCAMCKDSLGKHQKLCDYTSVSVSVVILPDLANPSWSRPSWHSFGRKAPQRGRSQVWIGSAVTFSPDLSEVEGHHGKSQAMCVYMIIEVMAELKQPLGIQHFGHWFWVLCGFEMIWRYWFVGDWDYHAAYFGSSQF